jgi:hypothetical protein
MKMPIDNKTRARQDCSRYHNANRFAIPDSFKTAPCELQIPRHGVLQLRPRATHHTSEAPNDHGYAQGFSSYTLRAVNHVRSCAEQGEEKPKEHVSERHGISGHDGMLHPSEVGEPSIFLPHYFGEEARGLTVLKVFAIRAYLVESRASRGKHPEVIMARKFGRGSGAW